MRQDHHRSSAALYSRDDKFNSMLAQRTLAKAVAVAQGFRPDRRIASQRISKPWTRTGRGKVARA